MWDAFFRQTGVVRVGTINEWADAALAFCQLPPPQGKGVFLVCGGGGNSVIYSDTCVREGLDVPRLSPASMERLRPMGRSTLPDGGSGRPQTRATYLLAIRRSAKARASAWWAGSLFATTRRPDVS